MKKEIENIIGYWLANRKNTMNFSLLEKGIQNLLNKQREEIKEKVDNLYIHTNPFKKGDETNFYKNIIKELNNI